MEEANDRNQRTGLNIEKDGGGWPRFSLTTVLPPQKLLQKPDEAKIRAYSPTYEREPV
jgi:hypothetical protein